MTKTITYHYHIFLFLCSISPEPDPLRFVPTVNFLTLPHSVPDLALDREPGPLTDRSATSMRTFDDLLCDLGGLGKFQVAHVTLVNLNNLFTGWSMLMMSFAGLTPDFRCVSDLDLSDNATTNVCHINGTSCPRHEFTGSDVTVVSEWALVCGEKWPKQVITSVQMVGVLVGALLGGQLSDSFGRKKAMYGFTLFHILSNVAAAFSVSWQMFAAMRFSIGIGIGSILVVYFPFSMEFINSKWRSVLLFIPTWALGVSVFAIAAMFLNNWWHLHLACAVLSAPSLLGCFFVPESVRWLTLKGRIDDAHKVVQQIATVNGKQVPSDVHKIFQDIVDKENAARETTRAYSYIDLFRSKKMVWIDLTIFVFWFSLSLCFYGISFGVSSLSGNLYLNIFLLATLELPPRYLSVYFINKLGRKPTSIICYLLSFLPMLGCILAELAAPEDKRGLFINILAMVAKMMIGAAWGSTNLWTTELYPTVVRNLGLAWANFGARVGGILAPLLIDLEGMPIESYVIMSAVLFLSTILCFTLEETMGKDLQDSLQNGKTSRQVEGGDT